MIGFVLVDKPPGPTSHDVVDVVRRSLHIRRVGHAGTLDPPASGLLVVAVGAATRLLRFVQGLQKTYETSAVLGVRTSTLDASGDVISRSDVEAAPEDIRAAAASLVGEISQVPPALSAVKVGGERAYRRAKRGETVELAPRTVTVHSFDILRTSTTAFDARIICSSGTYVRSLVADLGERVGCGAHVAHLRRTAIGELSVADAAAPSDVTPEHLRAVEDVLGHLPRVDVDAQAAARARHGQTLEGDAVGDEILVCGPDGAVGVFRSSEEGLRPVTVLGPA